MTEADYDSISSEIEGLYNSLPSACNATYCPQADWAGCVLRMAGHDSWIIGMERAAQTVAWT